MTRQSTARNTALINGASVTWTQYTSRTARHDGRERSGRFWSLAPGPNAIWVRPDTPATGEPVAIKVYRSVRQGGTYVDAVAYDDDLTAAKP